MGTSGSYVAPPSWGPLKGEVTQAAMGGKVSPTKAGHLLGSFVAYNGGVAATARGGGGTGRVADGKAARGVASRLAAFVATVGEQGFERALQKAGWDDLVGRPFQEVLFAIVDRIGGHSHTLDETDARTALSKMMEEYFASAATPAELEGMLKVQVTQLEDLLTNFFGFYLYEVFCRVFFERLVQRVGETQAYAFLADIQDFIKSSLRNRSQHANLGQVDWEGPHGQRLIEDIMETTLNIFGS